MKKFTKAQIDEKAKHREDVAKAHAALTDAIDAFNAAKAEAWAKVEAAQTEYRDAVSAANEWRDNLHGDAQSYFDERSEKWQEGDAGQQYSAWLDTIGTEFDESDEIDEPEDLEAPEDVSESIEQLPEAADEA